MVLGVGLACVFWVCLPAWPGRFVWCVGVFSSDVLGVRIKTPTGVRWASEPYFVFYDTETTGTNTAFDPILQFGAVKTDHELREPDRFEIRCRVLPYVVPSPGAMRVTGVTVDQLIDPGLPSHYEMVCAIKAKSDEWSPAIYHRPQFHDLRRTPAAPSPVQDPARSVPHQHERQFPLG